MQIVTGCAVVFAAAAIVAAPAQDRPGQPTQARVWIQNRGAEEAVPVTVGAIPPVQIAGTPTVTFPPATVFQTRPASQLQWQYRTITIPLGDDPTRALNAAGLEGWETTGIAVPGAKETQIVMKKPR